MSQRILIAEDEPLLRQLIVIELRDNGFDVIEAQNGEEALQLLETERPDLILLDLLMPKADGYTVLARLQEKRLNIPVIVLSNLDSLSDQKRCAELGAKDFLVKSNFETNELVELIKRYLAVEV